MINELSRNLRIAARSIGRAGLAHAYGHCSARIDANRFLVTLAVPLALVRPGDACTTVSLDGEFPSDVLGEVRIHREIYRQHPQVGGIVRCMPPFCQTLAAHGLAPRARHGLGSYFYPAPRIWPDPQLVRTDEAATALVETMEDANAIMLRGNGVVVAGETIEQATVLAWYLEDAARIELQGLSAGLPRDVTFDDASATQRATWSGAILERMWDWMAEGDPEKAPA